MRRKSPQKSVEKARNKPVFSTLLRCFPSFFVKQEKFLSFSLKVAVKLCKIEMSFYDAIL